MGLVQCVTQQTHEVAFEGKVYYLHIQFAPIRRRNVVRLLREYQELPLPKDLQQTPANQACREQNELLLRR